MLSASDLSYMRSAINELFPDTASILNLAWSSDGEGSQVETWGTISSCACRVDYGSGREAMTGGALMPYQKAVISMPYGTVVTPANRVKVDDDIFSVQAVNQAQSWRGVTRVTAELIP
jgi:head-tail adaptor